MIRWLQDDKGKRRARRYTPDHAVLSDEAFHQTIRRERLLAERHRRRFSLAVFRFTAEGRRGAKDRRTLAILKRHVRLTDEVGLLGRSGIGVLLRETGRHGALRFCKRAAAAMAEHGAPVVWRILGYPREVHVGSGPIDRGRTETPRGRPPPASPASAGHTKV
jgi:hypothetical protein